MSGKVECSVWDKDLVKDEVIASFELNLNQVLNGEYSTFRYINLYGAPIDADNAYATMMNQNAEIGSLWKGRVLIKAEAEKKEKPGNKREEIKDKDILRQAANVNKSNVFEVSITLYETYFLPSDQEYNVEVQIEDESIKFSKKESKNNYINWGELTTSQYINKECSDFKTVII